MQTNTTKRQERIGRARKLRKRHGEGLRPQRLRGAGAGGGGARYLHEASVVQRALQGNPLLAEDGRKG